MPRYEIVVHVTSEMDCTSAEEASAVIRRQIMEGPAGPNQLLHLAVWREASAHEPSPVDPVIRDKLIDFFRTLEHRAAEAEETFRGQVEAILLGTSTHEDNPATRPSPRAGRAAPERTHEP